MKPDDQVRITFIAEEIPNNPKFDINTFPLPKINDHDRISIRSQFSSIESSFSNLGNAMIIQDKHAMGTIVEPWTVSIKGDTRKDVFLLKNKLLRSVNQNRSKQLIFNATNDIEYLDQIFTSHIIKTETEKGETLKELESRINNCD